VNAAKIKMVNKKKAMMDKNTAMELDSEPGESDAKAGDSAGESGLDIIYFERTVVPLRVVLPAEGIDNLGQESNHLGSHPCPIIDLPSNWSYRFDFPLLAHLPVISASVGPDIFDEIPSLKAQGVRK